MPARYVLLKVTGGYDVIPHGGEVEVVAEEPTLSRIAFVADERASGNAIANLMADVAEEAAPEMVPPPSRN